MCRCRDNVIKTLQSDLIEETQKLELVNKMYKKEKEKNKINETYTRQMIDEFTDQLHEKEIEIALERNESNILKHDIESAEFDVENLKHKIITLEHVLNEKNKTIQDMLKSQNKQQQGPATTSSLLSNRQLHINSKLEEQMDIILDDLGTYQKTIAGYEKVLYNMQNVIQQQSKISNYWIAKYQRHKDIEYEDRVNKLMDYLTKEKEVILFQHQNEMDNLKDKYNTKIACMTDTQVSLKNDIRDLNDSLKLKNAHIKLVEKIAKGQLIETLATQHLTEENSNIQSLKMNDLKNSIPESQYRCTAASNTKMNSSNNHL